MAEAAREGFRPTDPVGRALFETARILAILGGFLVFVTAAMVTVSVTGRYLFAAPVPGDYDLVAIACGCAVFAFLPYCQLVRGNVMVDFFTNDISSFAKEILDAIGNLLYLLIMILFTWRLYFGGLELWSSGEVLANFNFYRWWTVPLNFICLIVLIAAIAYSLVRQVGELQRGRT